MKARLVHAIRFFLLSLALQSCQSFFANSREPQPSDSIKPGPENRSVADPSSEPSLKVPDVPKAEIPAKEHVSFVLNPDNEAARDAEELKDTDPKSAKLLQLLSEQPTAVWFGPHKEDGLTKAQNLASLARQQNRIVLLVIKGLPHRDCGNFSTPGLEPAPYRSWIQNIAKGLNETPAYIILEPEALTLMSCLSEQERLQRSALLRDAITELKLNPQVRVYVDIGHPEWLDVAEATRRLSLAGIEGADGFALNVGHYHRSEDCIDYGRQISARVGGKPFVIDSSRNGNGPLSAQTWCNPPGRAIGHLPLAPTGLAGLDAYLWLKRPGESDGTCNGGPQEGQWWRKGALELMKPPKARD